MFSHGACSSHALDPPVDSAISQSAKQAPPLAPLHLAMPSRKQPNRRQPVKVYALEEKPLIMPASRRGIEPRGVPHSVNAGIFLLVGAILAAPMLTLLTSASGVSIGVFAAPCASAAAATSAAAGEGGEHERFPVINTNTMNLASIFDCEGGDFHVSWTGEVYVTSTIVIGAGTTVRISGERISSKGNSSLSDNEVVANATNGLLLPLGLTSAAVGVGPPKLTVGASETVSIGPMFKINGGQLFLEDLIVRGGFAASNADGLEGFGGGVYAVNSVVSVSRCDFSDNFAEHFGGGIFVTESTLQVVDSLFRSCKAGNVPDVEDEGADGAGGGISVSALVVWEIKLPAHLRLC